MDNCRPSVLLVGDAKYHEFAVAVAWLRANTRLDIAPSVDDALVRFGRQPRFWHTIVFAQERPGQFRSTDIQRVSQALPLAHLIALLGSWCEGETRSGRPWPGVVRVYWHQWPARCDSELRIDIAPTTWQLPRTSSEAERANHALQQLPPAGHGLVAVSSRNALLFHALARACRLAGYSTVWNTSPLLQRADGAVAVLWDGHALGDTDFARLEQVSTSMCDVPVIAMMGFPRHDLVRRARACGATSVLTVPFLLPDLWAILRSVARGGDDRVRR